MVSFPSLSRRRFLAGSAAALAVAGCDNSAGTNGAQRIDNRVDVTLTTHDAGGLSDRDIAWAKAADSAYAALGRQGA